MSRDVSRPIPFLPASRAVFDLALEGMVWTRRSLFMAVLVGLPIGFGVLYRVVLAAKIPPQVTGFDLYGAIVVLYYLRATVIPGVLPMVALFYATALVGDEVEGKTITYLLTRPVPRMAILAGKFAAYLVTTLSLALPSLIITFLLLTSVQGARGISAAFPDLLRDMGVATLALVVHGAVFALLGVLFRRPMVLGLFLLLVWESLSLFPGDLPRLTLAAYLKSLVSHRPAAEGLGALFGVVLPTPLCLAVLLGVSLGGLALALWIFAAREYVLEQ